MEVRSVRLRSLAKVNLDLRVLHKRSDGYHEIRTVFQTISLSDTIRLSYSVGAKSGVQITGSVDIPGNLIKSSAQAILEITKAKGFIHCDFQKSIPIGGGLGGGSSNAAAILLALPVLLGKRIPLVTLEEIAAKLGSDIGFFLYGGMALGLGRGTELYPMPDLKIQKGYLVASGIHVSTPQAFGDLRRTQEESTPCQNLHGAAWNLEVGSFANCTNDFETVVYKQHPKLRLIHRKLHKAGAKLVRMSGSGSSIYAFFDGNEPNRSILEEYAVHRIETVSRRRYQSLWLRQLREHIIPGEIWPPQSRYAL